MIFFVFLVFTVLTGISTGLSVYFMGKKKERSFAAFYAGLAVIQLLFTIGLLVILNESL